MPDTATALPAALTLSRTVLGALHRVALRELGGNAPSALQEIGVAGGAALHEGFLAHVAAEYDVAEAGDLDAQYFGEALSGYLSGLGWGTVVATQLSPTVLALDSPDWAEADPEAQAPYPSCHLSTGLLADFLTRLGGGTLAVLEVECRSTGAPQCRFLVGSPETLGRVYEVWAGGGSYLEAASSA